MKHLKPVNAKARKLEDAVDNVERDVVALQVARQHQRVVRQFAPALDAHFLVGAVNPHRAQFAQQRDVLVSINAGRAQQQPVHIQVALEVGLRQRRPLIGRRRLIADQRDLARETALPQPLRGLAAGLAGADNDDAVDFARTHNAFVFEASPRQAQGALDAARPPRQHPRP
jgi:hypothetical protein